MATSEPILNVPRSVTGVAVLLVAVQFIRGLLPDELDLTAAARACVHSGAL